MDLEGQVAFYKDYWEQVAEPTDKACPEDGTELHVLMTEESEHVVHFARCKRGHWWRFDKKGEARWIRIGEPLASKLTKQFKGVWE